jgi:uncharacterized membrane protein
MNKSTLRLIAITIISIVLLSIWNIVVYSIFESGMKSITNEVVLSQLHADNSAPVNNIIYFGGMNVLKWVVNIVLCIPFVISFILYIKDE